MSNTNKVLLAIGVIILAIAIFLLVPRQGDGNGTNSSAELTQFAQCLASKGATMYGAYWCPHCQNEKKAFGSAFKYIPYVECTQETQKCLTNGINGYPTWIFGDPTATSSRRFEGEQGLNRLATISGCPLTNATGTQDQKSE